MKPHRASELECEATLLDAALRGGWRRHGERTVQMKGGSHQTPVKGEKGWPDLFLIHPKSGELLIVELKRTPNKLEPEQELWIEAFAMAHLSVEVWWVPEQLDEKIAYLMASPSQRLKARRT